RPLAVPHARRFADPEVVLLDALGHLGQGVLGVGQLGHRQQLAPPPRLPHRPRRAAPQGWHVSAGRRDGFGSWLVVVMGWWVDWGWRCWGWCVGFGGSSGCGFGRWGGGRTGRVVRRGVARCAWPRPRSPASGNP